MLLTRLDDGTPDLKYAHYGDSGLDLYAAKDTWVWPFQAVMIPTGVRIFLPEGYEAQVRPRSSMSRDGWLQNIGTVDQPYTGEIKAVLTNGKLWPRKIRKGQKIAQLVVSPVAFCEVWRDGKEIPQPTIQDAVRGAGGFGSTGS